MPRPIMIAGIGPDVGKTVVSSIVAEALQADYWKPVECDHDQQYDSKRVRTLLSEHLQVFPSIYSLPYSLSPHHAAERAHVTIDPKRLTIPATKRPLVIEGAGGVLVPITYDITTLDVFRHWDCRWIVVSRHFLGSINQTLLTIQALRSASQEIIGVVFNGEENKGSEQAILQISKFSCIGRLFPEPCIDRRTLQRYAKEWQIP